MNTVSPYRSILTLACGIFLIMGAGAQNSYRYSVDLNNVKDDKLAIELLCPKITAQQTMFYLPKIVPGTYMNSNYGKYVHDLKAFDKAGKEIPVKKSYG